jgi:hypothetical protein
MNEQLMVFAYLTPLMGVLGLFWHVARKLGEIEALIAKHDDEVRRLRSDILSLQTLLSVLVDSRRAGA